MIKSPGFFLCFDDQYIDEWYKWLDFFDSNKMKATFYIANLGSISPSQWEKTREIRNRGHTIGCHGFRHARAGATIKRIGCEQFCEEEIFQSLRKFSEEAIGGIRHYCYPWGGRTEESDKCLLEIFDTLRIGRCKVYTKSEMLKARLIGSGDYGKQAESKYSGHEGRLNEIIRDKSFVNFHMHEPVKHRIEYLASFGKTNGINFYPMSALDRK